MYWSLSWSPDNQRIAYEYQNGGWKDATVRDIFIINADGSDPIQLTDTSQAIPKEECGFPLWSPDGTQLSITCGLVVSSYRSIYIIRTDGSSRRIKIDIPFTADNIGGAAWQPWWPKIHMKLLRVWDMTEGLRTLAEVD